MRRTRSTSYPKPLTSLLPDRLETPLSSETEKQLRPLTNRKKTDSLLAGKGIVQKAVPQSITPSSQTTDLDPPVHTLANRHGSDTVASVQRGPKAPRFADSTGIAAQGKLCKSKIFTNTQNFECILRSYYDNLFGDCDAETDTSAVVLRSGDKNHLIDQDTDLLKCQYILRSNQGVSERKLHSRDSTALFQNRDPIPRNEQKTQRGLDNVSRAKVTGRACQRFRHHSEKKHFSESAVPTPTYDYVLRSNHCLLKRKRSFTEKLSRSFDHVLRFGKDRQSNDNALTQISCQIDSDVGSRRRVSFLEPERVMLQETDHEFLGEVTSSPGSGMKLSCQGMITEHEGLSENKKIWLWGRPTTILLGIIVGLRMLYDAWSDNFGVFWGVDFLHWPVNKSLIK